MKTCKYCFQTFTPIYRKPKQITCGSKSCLQQYKNEWARNNPKSKLDWIKRNPEKRKKVSKDYIQKNWSYYVEYSSLRARNQLQAKPSWLNEWEEFLTKELYHLAKLRKLEVDHIIPIKHDLVCGLHVPWNLQLLTRSQNAKKSNKFGDTK